MRCPQSVNYPAFRDDLESLASSDENFFEVETAERRNAVRVDTHCT